MGRGWVWGSGRGVVTVRFETAETGPGPVRSYPIDEPDLKPWRPELTERVYSARHARRTTSLTTPPGPRSRLVHAAGGCVRRSARAHPRLPGLRPAVHRRGAVHRAGLLAVSSSGRPPTSLLEVPSGAWADTVSATPAAGARRRPLRLLLRAVDGGADVRRVRRRVRALGGELVARLGDLRGVRLRPPPRPGRQRVLPSRDRRRGDLGARAQPGRDGGRDADRGRLGPDRCGLGQRRGVRGRDRAGRVAAGRRAALSLRCRSDDRDGTTCGYLAMLRSGLAESLHPRLARAVLLAALVPAFLAFDEYFGLLAVDARRLADRHSPAGGIDGGGPGPRRGVRATAPTAPPGAGAGRCRVAGRGRSSHPARSGVRGDRARLRRAPGGDRGRRDRPPAPHPRHRPRHGDLGERTAQRARGDRAVRLRGGRAGGRIDGRAGHRAGASRRGAGVAAALAYPAIWRKVTDSPGRS